jgi:hypothetical protein
MLKRLVVAAGLVLAAPLSANADVFVIGHVTAVEASYLPSAAGFFINAGYSGCPAALISNGGDLPTTETRTSLPEGSI